jgi:hypothetical protein
LYDARRSEPEDREECMDSARGREISDDGFSRFRFNPSRILLLSLLIGLPEEFGSAAGRTGTNAAMALISASLSCCSFRFLLDLR